MIDNLFNSMIELLIATLMVAAVVFAALIFIRLLVIIGSAILHTFNRKLYRRLRELLKDFKDFRRY